MPEVERCQIQRVEDEHQLANPEVGVYPKKDERGGKEIVYDEVRTDIRGDHYYLRIEGEEAVKIAEL